MIRVINSLIILTLLSVSCSSNSNETIKDESVHSDESVHEHSSEQLQLNKGEKWVVVPKMMGYIRDMENEIDAFSNTEIKDYEQLSNNLLISIDSLTSNCTMQGEAHDELHKWLVPYIESVNQLSEIDKDNDKVEKIDALQNSYLTFNKFFK